VKTKFRRLLVLLLFLLLGGYGFSLWTGYTLYAIVHKETAVKMKENVQKGDVVSPLQGMDFDNGNWTAYLVLTTDDFDQLKPRFSRNCLKLTDRQTLKSMSQDLKMIYTGGDIATVASYLIFVKDGKVVFNSAIHLSKEGFEGLQSPYFGYMEPQNKGVLWKYCSKFEPVYAPFIIL
jgi:hypothetical protein